MFLRSREPDPEVEAAIRRRDVESAPLPEREKALLRFVTILTEAAYKIADEHVQALRDHGWTDPQIAEAVYIGALFAFFNRVADAFGIEEPNFEGHPELDPNRRSPSGDDEPES